MEDEDLTFYQKNNGYAFEEDVITLNESIEED